MKFAALMGFLMLETGCVALHHVQVGEVDARPGNIRMVDIKVSETGINLDDAAAIARGVASSKRGKEAADEIREIIALFQFGPKTGNPVYVEDYARFVWEDLWAQCPSGNLTNLFMVRESNNYPVVSGEIVRIRGECRL